MNPRKDETSEVAPRRSLENKANAVAFNNNHVAHRDTENAFAQGPADAVGLSPTARALLPLTSRVRADLAAAEVAMARLVGPADAAVRKAVRQ